MANDREILETRGVVANGTSSWAAQDFKPSYGFDYMARFQQRHLREKEQRLLELYDQRQQRAYHIASKGSAGSINGLNKPKDPAMERQTASRTTTIMRETSSNGKVRQMFDDRRQATVKGIDRSHPLEPLDNKSNNRKRITNSVTTPSYVTGNRSTAATRQAVTVKRVVRADHNSNAEGAEQTDSSNKSYSLQYNQTISDLGNGNNACLPINRNGYENKQTFGNKRTEALAKVQLMDHGRGGKRVTNDLESKGTEQVPTNLASNKLPITRSAANKSSAAETKPERSRVSNVKGDGVAAKTTFTKKQPEVPSVSYRSTNSSSPVQQSPRRGSTETNKPSGVSTKKAVVPKKSPEIKTKEVKSLGRAVPRSNKLLPEKKYKKISEDLFFEDAVQNKIQRNFLSSEKKNMFNGSPRKSSDSVNPFYSSRDEVRSTSSLSSDSIASRGNYQTTVTKKPVTTPKANSSSLKPQNSTPANNSDVIFAKCKICGRNFAQERVARHEQICEKSAQKKRRQFDSVMCRVKGTELESFVRKKETKKESKVKKSSDWRKMHEEFIATIRSAKQVQAHLAAGGKLSDLPPPPVSDNSHYIQCPHCNRKFNEAAAERHIPVCERMKHNKTRAAPKPRR